MQAGPEDGVAILGGLLPGGTGGKVPGRLCELRRDNERSGLATIPTSEREVRAGAGKKTLVQPLQTAKNAADKKAQHPVEIATDLRRRVGASPSWLLPAPADYAIAGG